MESLVQRSTVKSLSLQDLVNARPPFFRRVIETAKTGLMIWGAISLSAGAGYSAFYLHGLPDEPVLASQEQVADEREAEEPAPIEVAALEEDGTLPTTPDTAETVAALARLPRPRPDEPVITGSIALAPDSPYARLSRRDRTMDPCQAWNSLGTPFRVHCVQQGRAEPIYYPPSAYRW